MGRAVQSRASPMRTPRNRSRRSTAAINSGASRPNASWLNDALTLLGRVHQVSGVGTDEVKITAGDPKRGEELFFTSPTASCASCHTVKGKGGAVGPILDGIALRSDRAYIVESLMD